MDKRFNRDLTFKPEILPKSREISQSRSRSQFGYRSKPLLPNRSTSRDSLLMNGPILTNRSRKSINRDLIGVSSFSQNTRPQSSRGAPSMSKLDLSSSLNKKVFQNTLTQETGEFALISPHPYNGGRVNTDVAAFGGSEAFNMTLVSESIGIAENTRQFQPGQQEAMPDRQFSMSNQSFARINNNVIL
jgi:hypothetical protein